jgi:hypothetical protein
MLFMWDDVYSMAAGMRTVSGSRQQVPDSVVNTRKKERFNGIYAFSLLIIDEFRLPLRVYAAHVNIIIYECDGVMIQTFWIVRNDFSSIVTL